MKKFIALLVLVLGFVLGTVTPALAGNGTVFRTEQACLLGVDTATIYSPTAMANRTAASTPSNGYRHAGVTGRVCVLEHTSMAGSSNGETAGWWWVAIDGGNLMVSSDGRSWRDSRCENAIRRIAQRPQEVATAVAECTDCNRPALAPQPAPPVTQIAPQPQYGSWQQPTPQPAQVVYRAPVQLSFIPTSAMPAAGSVFVGGNTYNTFQQPQQRVPDFGGETNPPLPNPTPLPPTDFGGVTNPGVPGPVPGSTFGGVTNPSVPGPVPGPGGGLLPPNNSGGVPLPLPGPVFGGGSNNTFIGGIAGPVAGPVFNGGNNNTFVGGLSGPVPRPANNGGSTFVNTFGGNTFGIQGPSNGVVASTTTFVGGLPGPSTTFTFTSGNTFGGTTFGS